MDVLSHIMLIYSSLQYILSPLIRNQLAARFPLFYPIDGTRVPVSWTLLLTECVGLYVDTKVLQQLFNYRRTKHIHQGASYILLSIVLICLIFHVFTFACSSINLPLVNMGKFGIYYIEHINYIWVCLLYTSRCV